MNVTLLGIVTLVNEVQSSKALPSMESTPSGIVTLLNEEQPLKALEPISETVFPPSFDGMTNAPIGSAVVPLTIVESPLTS